MEKEPFEGKRSDRFCIDGYLIPLTLPLSPFGGEDKGEGGGDLEGINVARLDSHF